MKNSQECKITWRSNPYIHQGARDNAHRAHLSRSKTCADQVQELGWRYTNPTSRDLVTPRQTSKREKIHATHLSRIPFLWIRCKVVNVCTRRAPPETWELLDRQKKQGTICMFALLLSKSDVRGCLYGEARWALTSSMWEKQQPLLCHIDWSWGFF